MVNNICLRCNKEFTTTVRASKYCSIFCRCNFSYVPAPSITFNCNICSKEVTTTVKHSKYCSNECRKIGKKNLFRLRHPEVEIRIIKPKSKEPKSKEVYYKKCLICEKQFSTRKEIKVFCSSTCNQRDKTLRKRKIIKQLCSICNNGFESGRLKKYCSFKCRNRFHNKYIRIDKTCDTCGKEFISTWKRRFCSKECSTIKHNYIKKCKEPTHDWTELIQFYELISNQKISKEQFVIEVIVDKRRYRLTWVQCFGDTKGLNLVSIVDKYFNYSPLPPLKYVTHFFTKIKRRYDNIKFGTPIQHEKIKRENE